jgi:hypothetical protein
MLDGSNTLLLNSNTDNYLWWVFSIGMTSTYEESMKWKWWYGMKFVWNSIKSTLITPSNWSETASEDTTYKYMHPRGIP